MEAFLEWLCPCKCGGVVRAGPYAIKYGDPWDSQVTFKVLERCVEFIAFAGHTTYERTERAISVVNQATGLPVEWDRLGTDPYRYVQIAGVNGEGRILMAKKTLHEQHGSKKDSAGNQVLPDAGTFETISKAYVDGIKNGTVIPLGIGEVVVGPHPSGKTIYARTFIVAE